MSMHTHTHTCTNLPGSDVESILSRELFPGTKPHADKVNVAGNENSFRALLQSKRQRPGASPEI